MRKATIKKEVLALKQVLDIIPGNIYWKNAKGEFIWCNLSQVQDIGASSVDEIIGKTAFDTLPYEQAKEIFDADIKIMSSKKMKIIEEWIVRSDNEKRRMLSYKSPLLDKSENVVGIIGISLDITEKYFLEE